MGKRFEIHSHTMYSNLRLLDSVNRPETLVQKAIDIGLSGIAITDHEALCCHEWVSQKQKELAETHSDFKVAYGNEIYLTNTREMGQQYYHFILIAKDAIGHKMMRELSSDAWLNSYYDRGMRRVPTLKSELAKKVEQYGKGHLIMSSACLGGEINASLLQMVLAERDGREQDKKKYHRQIVEMVQFTRNIAGDDMYLEIAPGTSPEQIIVNNRMVSLARCFGMKILCGSDSHYLNKEDRWIHKAYLNSKGGDREVDSFYEFAYLQDDDEVRANLYDTELNYDELVANSTEVYDKIENFSLLRKQHVPQVTVPDYPKKKTNTGYPTLDYLYNSDDPQDRYWVNFCVDELENRNLKNETYMSRLEEEADIKKTISDKLETNMFSYPIFLQHYIDLFWECGSTVGAGRGSSCSGLNHWLLGITQLDPIVHDLPFWRYINKDRVEIGDIDIDICPSKRPEIFRRIREERGELGCVQVCTFGTETTKSAIQTACRGYRSDEHPKGINNDIAQYLTSLIPSERGFVWPVSDAVNGNKDKGRKPVYEFINEVNKYPGLLEIIQKIEGLVKQYGIHASGVVFPEDDPYEMSAFMRAPDGTIVTQFSLHPQENMGLTKYDFLVTEIQDVITQCMLLLQKDGKMEQGLSLRELYNKYLHPDILPVEDGRIWDALAKGNILKCFQYDSQVGSQTAKLLKPRTPREMANCNSIMRLMASEKGGETPSNRYARMKNDMSQWYVEMRKYGLTDNEQKILEPYYLPSYATPGQQEDMMLILMDENICGFTLKEANNCRKICAKKKMSEIPKLHEQVLSKAKSQNLGKYVWDTAILPQMGYSFSLIHSLAYSFVGIQTIYLSTLFDPVYWNTACLRVDSGLDEDATSNYNKISKAVCNIVYRGIEVKPININKSQYMFEPDPETNSILYGLKGLNGVGSNEITQILEGRPFTSFDDFKERTNIDKTATVSLIKSGAFDEFGNRTDIMRQFLFSTCNPKKRVTLQNFNALMENDLIPKELDFQRRLFAFNKALKANCSCGDSFTMTGRYYEFFEKFFNIDDLVIKDNVLSIPQSAWKKLYDKGMTKAKDYLKEHQEEMVNNLNEALLSVEWDKYATGNLSHWEMDSMGFYFGEHELSQVNGVWYGIQYFKDLPVEPIAESEYNGIPIRKITRICGCVIAKDDVKSIVTVLTPDSGVIGIRFGREEYAQYNRRLSEVKPDGTKTVIESGWFQRGSLIMVAGYRRGDTFVAKKYKSTKYPLICKITQVNDNGTMLMTDKRAGEIKE